MGYCTRQSGSQVKFTVGFNILHLEQKPGKFAHKILPPLNGSSPNYWANLSWNWSLVRLVAAQLRLHRLWIKGFVGLFWYVNWIWASELGILRLWQDRLSRNSIKIIFLENNKWPSGENSAPSCFCIAWVVMECGFGTFRTCVKIKPPRCHHRIFWMRNQFHFPSSWDVLWGMVFLVYPFVKFQHQQSSILETDFHR